MTVELTAGIHFLKERGLNLYSILDWQVICERLPSLPEKTKKNVSRFTKLILIGSGGKDLWNAIKESKPGFQTESPIDFYTEKQVDRFVKDYLSGEEIFTLYPSNDHSYPLLLFGELAGWGEASPLGMGIHQKYGLWHAYRAAFLINADLPIIRETKAPSPCIVCNDKSCLSGCVGNALSIEKGMNFGRCREERLQKSSPCRYGCAARVACPYAREHRYGEEQIRYHASVSQKMIHALQKDDPLMTPSAELRS